MKHTFSFFALMGIGLIVSGCVKPPIEGRNEPYVPAQVHFAQQQLRDVTAVGVPILSRDDEGSLLFVNLPIRAATNEQLFVDYRVTFFDRNREQISQTNWLPKVLAPNVPDQIRVNSMSLRASDFQIDFRYSK